ncbi:MAG: DNA topoisomerase (ATP-hydrolyzing) [Methanosphaera sp.]|nr:DNA topoisomerase (ATP-hydrolyzing) [Methanosphaera sp.]
MQNNDLIKELSTNFIEYAASVNSDRAIPNATDGLKPVAKRILYGAFTGGRTSNKPHVKCAKIVGDVMGSYHPHGDSSIYGALVRLAQDWVMRYPLIDFHGNVGNQAGDGPAAPRYTEARLSKLTEDGMLQGLKKNNVDFIPNYDETTEEPVELPSIFPNLLCNPNSGIGVAMACSWAPHNLGEVAAAINQYLAGEEPTLPGPDFPTGGVIINSKDIPAIMRTGHGSVKVRGKFEIDKQKIIFTEIPYGTSVEGLMTEIGEVSDAKEIEGIDNIRDESNKKGVRIVIECDKGINPASIVNKLFAKTNLQSSFSYNQVALVDKVPTELNLKDCIKIYVDHNIDCITRETKFDLDKAIDRLEIVNGLLRALEDIDNIIALIKSSENAAAAKENLIKKYQFTENQAKAILAMRLSSLAKLEKVELEQEAKELENKIKDLKDILANENRQKDILKSRLADLVKKYGDARRTELTHIEVKPEDKIIEEVTPEDCVVILSQTGDIKRVPKNSFKVQRKNGKGVKTKDDVIMSTISTNTIDNLLLFTKKGKMFKIIVDEVPVGTNASKGAHVGTLINMDQDDEVIAITSLARSNTAKYVVFFTKRGLMKKTLLDEYTKVKRSTGIAAIKINDGDSIANVEFINEEDILVITKNGMSIHFESKNVNPIGRVAAGVKTIKLDENDEVVVGLPIHSDNDTVAIFSTKGYGKKTSIKEFTVQGRGGKGLVIYKPSVVYGQIAGATIISDNDTILLTGQPSSICIAATDLPLLTRTSFGNIMVKSNISSIVKF